MQNLIKFHITSLLLLLMLISCETKEYAKEDNPKQFLNSNSDLENPVSFNGLTSITNVDDYGARLNWNDATDMKNYKIYDVTGGANTLIYSADAPASNFDVTGLQSGTSYTFKVIGQSTDGRMAYNDSLISITTLVKPNAPNYMYRSIPIFTQTTGAEERPSFFIDGLRKGDEVKLYSDTCSTEVASAVADGSSITIRSDVNLTAGSYSFHTKVINPNGVSSNCISSFYSYTYQTCPLGYALVPSDIELGSEEFCVMTYEAKAWIDSNSDGIVSATDSVDSDGIVSSESTSYKPGAGAYGQPWRNIDAKTAKSQCQNLGENYDLVSNLEWMAIARNIEEQSANWSSSTVGVGCLKRGNTGSTDACSYNYSLGDIESDGGQSVNAKHILSNLEEIYHFSGNVSEWTDMGQSEELTLGPLNCESSWTDIEQAQSFCTGGLIANEFQTDNAGNLTFATYENVNDIFPDKNGNLFIATDGGLAKSAGFSEIFTDFETLSGVLESNVEDIIRTDNSQGVYLSTSSGLYISSDGGRTFSYKTTSDGLGSNTINDIFVDTNNYVYVATSAGLGISTDNGASFTNYTKETNSLASNNILSVHVDGTNIYAGTDTGLSLSVNSGTSFTSKTTVNGLPSNTIEAVYVSGSNIYIGTTSGFSYSTDALATFTNKTTADGLGSILIWDIFLDDSNNIYLATSGGMAVSTDSGVSFTNYSTTNGLANNLVKAVYINSSDEIFVTTDNALSISRDGGTTFNSFANVTKILSDKSGKFFIASDTAISITADNELSFTNFTTLNGLTKNDITGGVALDSANRIFVGTSNGLNISTDGGITFTKKSLTNNNINDVVIDSNDNIYVATNGGLSISTDNGANFTNYDNATNTLASDIVLGLYIDGTTIYAGTASGLSYSTDGGTSFASKTTADGLPSNRVETVYASGATVYVGTNLGFAYSTDSMTSFTIVNASGGLGSLYIWDIFVDPNTDYIYLATQVGMAFTTAPNVSFNNRLTTHGLAANATKSVYVDNSGNIFVATEGGLSISTDNAASFTSKDSSDGLGGKSTIGLGQIFGGAGGAASRGGSYKSGDYAGIYALKLSNFSHQSFPDRGFRCVFRPN